MKEHIYILDDHPMITEGTAQLLMTDERYQVTIGKHYSELYNFIESNPISLLIIDYELQDKTALDLLPYLQKKIPQTPVLVYTMHTEFWIIKLLIKKAIESILLTKNKYYSPTALNIVLSLVGDHSATDSIAYTPSPREKEIINMLSCGYTSEEIAQKLNLSKSTIDTMRKNILLKSGAINVSHLMRLAFIKGWITT